MKVFISIAFSLFWLVCSAQEIDSSWLASTYFPNYARDTGTVLPDYRFVDEKGKQRSLAELRGKILYIDVWATYCAPCIAQFPHAEQLKKRLKAVQIDTLVQFVNICAEESRPKWKQLLKKYQPIGLNLYSKDTLLYRLWDVAAPPRHILVDASGKVMCYVFSGPDDGVIDYLLYAATQGVKPAEAVWTDFREQQFFKRHGKYTDDKKGQDYTRWHNAVANELFEYFKWKQAGKRDSR